jgi:hypothetical protein
VPNTVLTPSASGQTGVASGSQLVSQVARVVGGESEASIRVYAKDCINRVRIELNHHEFAFMKRTDAPITLVNGTKTYSLEAAFIKPAYARLIALDSTPYTDLDYYDEQSFAHLQPQQPDSRDLPLCYTLRNAFADGLITLFPTPGTTAASDYRLEVEYFARIPVITDDVNGPNMPEEVQNVLIIGGQAYLLREQQKESPACLQAFADFQRVKNLLITHARRFSEEKVRFRLGRERPRTWLGRTWNWPS